MGGPAISPNTHSFYTLGSGVLQPGVTGLVSERNVMPSFCFPVMCDSSSRCHCHRGQKKCFRIQLQVDSGLRQGEKAQGQRQEVFFSS